MIVLDHNLLRFARIQIARCGTKTDYSDGLLEKKILAANHDGPLWFAKTLHAPHYNDFFLLGVTPSAWIAGESGVGESCSQRVWTDKRLRLRSDKRGRVWS